MAVNIVVSTATPGAALSVGGNSPNIALTVGGTLSGTSDHRKLTHRDAPEQHPIAAITGLPDKLPDVLTNMDILDILNA